MSFADRDILTVSEINAQVSSLIEENFPQVSVLGEVSNFKKHSSGHLYMTLKDAESQLRTVCFRTDAKGIDFELEDGFKIVATGRLTLYEPYGQYQLVAHQLEKAGAGALEMAFRALCEKLEKEGLFAEEHKKSLPPFPFNIAVITSPTGAAVNDIVSTLRRRWPCVGITLLPVRVQGSQAVPEIINALSLLPSLGELDLVIVGRGGGSLEDLWAFNEESLARAIFECPLPVVSGVGHETDFTIADFVADARAATPTMAAEIAVPLAAEVKAGLDEKINRLIRFLQGRLQIHTARLQELLRSYALGRVRGQIERHLQKLDYSRERLLVRMTALIEHGRSRVKERLASLKSLSPKEVLRRGYAVCSHIITGKILQNVDEALAAEDIRVTFHDGRVLAHVKEKENEVG